VKRPLVVTVLSVAFSIGSAAPASAGFWAWLEEWSGPGPFKGYTFLFTACVQDGSLKPSPVAMNDSFHMKSRDIAEFMSRAPGNTTPEAVLLGRYLDNPVPADLFNRIKTLSTIPNSPVMAPPPSIGYALGVDIPDAVKILPDLKAPETRQGQTTDAAALANALAALYDRPEARGGPGHKDQRLICGYIDQGFFNTSGSSTNSERGFSKIRAHLSDLGFSARLHDGIDLGAGMGWVNFSGENVTAGTKFALTPIRLVVRPLLLAIPEARRDKLRWMGVLSVYWKETYVAGKLKASDFGSSTDTFSVDGELIRSFGFNADITALFPAKWGFK
jgi:hypothetical protein